MTAFHLSSSNLKCNLQHINCCFATNLQFIILAFLSHNVFKSDLTRTPTKMKAPVLSFRYKTSRLNSQVNHASSEQCLKTPRNVKRHPLYCALYTIKALTTPASVHCNLCNLNAFH